MKTTTIGLFAGMFALLAVAGCEQQAAEEEAVGGEPMEQSAADGDAGGGMAAEDAGSSMAAEDAGGSMASDSADTGGAAAGAGDGGTCFDTVACPDGQQISFGVSQEACAASSGLSWSGGEGCTGL